MSFLTRWHKPNPQQPPFSLILFNMILVGFLLLPLGYLIVRVSEDFNDAWQFVTQVRIIEVLGNSLFLAGAVAVGSVGLGVPLAWLTTRTDLKGRRYWTILCTLPLVLPSYVGAFALLSAIGPSGILQDWLGVARLPDIRGFFGAWFSITLFAFPYVFLSVRAGLRGLDPQLEAASLALGHNRWVTFRRIILPQLLPSIQAGALLTMLYALSDFGAVAFMRFNSFTRVIYIQNTQSFRPARVAMLSLELVLLAILILFIARRLEGNVQAYQRKSTRQTDRLFLGKWQIPAQLFVGGVVLFALVAPVGVITYWLVNGLQHGEKLNIILEPLQNSMRVAGMSALVAGLIGLPLVFLQVRYPNRLSQWLNIGASLGFALPGVVVAISLVFMATRYAPSLYQTFPLLIFAYVVRFLPQVLGPLRTSLLQINPHVEESALTLGKSRWQVLSTITAPLIRSGWVAGVALVFLTTLKELPATLILSPLGFKTLATQIWSATEEAFYARAAAPALVLVVISALSLIYVLDPDDE